jgi:hypothetical protein
MTAELDQTPERHRWALAGHRVTQLCVDATSARLHSWSLQASLDLRFSAPFVVRQADGAERAVDPHEPEQLAPLLTLVGREIEVLIVERDGVLTVGLSDGTVLRAEAHPRLEAFDVQGGGALEGLEYRVPAGGGRPWP